MSKRETDSLIISFLPKGNNPETEPTLLLIGRKKNNKNVADIVNAFNGDKAEKLWNELIGGK